MLLAYVRDFRSAESASLAPGISPLSRVKIRIDICLAPEDSATNGMVVGRGRKAGFPSGAGISAALCSGEGWGLGPAFGTGIVCGASCTEKVEAATDMT